MESQTNITTGILGGGHDNPIRDHQLPNENEYLTFNCQPNNPRSNFFHRLISKSQCLQYQKLL